ncbi:4-hydroxy-3-methylbut-2-en-1-yl diphosphate synthase (ferredoxin) [Hibiscus syriacus]|uniref:4-hydroxy-3-methylbut-2-en-1-yl diphosphate synthase (Ferredoxin) n=1 Tax=Hibiscus syriacus TaxID=106335 RepID=A0A6A3CV46_HIBSY|nr:4-hydroxy-3-methylbut-2-en-1-yl diphosphate synthase (ferredoxin) [Hibiscus syriacus]
MRIADKGADIVRITVQGKKEDACLEIKNSGTEKVFTPLVEKCKKYGRAMRIGINHGSLSDCIMSYYGDSPRGMVESAFEFDRICRKLDYHNFVFSMKANNPVVMVQAYRWLSDTIRVSLTEPPEEEIDPCGRTANLGTKAAELQQGVGEEVDYRGILHRDGSVLMSVSLDQLKDLATVDSIILRELPPVDDSDARLALKRLIDISMGVLTPLSEQLTKPLPNAIVLVRTWLYPCVATSPTKSWKSLMTLTLQYFIMLFEYLSENCLDFSVIHIQFPNGIHRDDLVINAGANAGALLVNGLGDGILLEAPYQDIDFLGNTSFNLLQGCRMRNTKTNKCTNTRKDVALPGVTIAIMGCIVNGPGEMADADSGYVGGAPGKIDLYVGKSIVKRGIAMEHATDTLIQLIKDHGRWVDPPAEE